MGKKNKQDDGKGKAAKAKEKAQAAQSAVRSDRRQSGSSGNSSVRSAVAAVGNKLSKGELKDLKRQGYSQSQLQKVADRVEAVKPSAQRKLDRWASKGEVAATPASGGQSTAASGPSPAELLNNLPAPSEEADDGPAISAGGSYGTADRTGWLAAELNAVDTFRPDTTPRLFNNYRPTDLSGQLRDAIAEANSFIDQHRSSWSSGDRLEPSVSGLGGARSLLDEDEQERWGLA